MRIFLASIALFALTAAQDSSQSIDGRWRSPGGNSIIDVAACGASRCGSVVWASDKGKKDASKTTPQLIGTKLLTGLEQDAKGVWRGKLFIPDQNKRVTAKIERAGPGQLKVSGCLAGKALCKSQTWTSFTAPLPADTSVPAPQ
jgi:uncharacterized protein (DUF2147 family)